MWQHAELFPDMHMLCLSDPSLKTRGTRFATYGLHEKFDSVDAFRQVALDAAGRLNIRAENIVFYGISQGGFLAAQVATTVVGSSALAQIAPLRATDSAQTTQLEAIRTEAFSGLTWEEIRKQFPERVELIERIRLWSHAPRLELITNRKDFTFPLAGAFARSLSEIAETLDHIGELRIVAHPVVLGHTSIPVRELATRIRNLSQQPAPLGHGIKGRGHGSKTLASAHPDEKNGTINLSDISAESPLILGSNLKWVGLPFPTDSCRLTISLAGAPEASKRGALVSFSIKGALVSDFDDINLSYSKNGSIRWFRYLVLDEGRTTVKVDLKLPPHCKVDAVGFRSWEFGEDTLILEKILVETQEGAQLLGTSVRSTASLEVNPTVQRTPIPASKKEADEMNVSSDANTGRPSLDSIGRAWNNDKSSLIHDYLVHYERALEHRRDEAFTLLEIGGRTSNSAKTWLQYFPKVRLVVADTHPHPDLFHMERVEVFQLGNFSPVEFGDLAGSVFPDVVIDDGSHRWSHQVSAFRQLFPVLRPGGLYVLEDLQTNFGEGENRFADQEASAYRSVMDLVDQLVAGSAAKPAADNLDRLFRCSVSSVQLIRQSMLMEKRHDAGEAFKVDSIASASKEVSVIQTAEYSRIPSEIMNASVTVQKAFDEISSNSSAGLGSVASGRVRGATVFGGGLVVDASRKILNESLNCARNVPESSGLLQHDNRRVWMTTRQSETERIKAIPGRQMVLLKSVWDANYGHWLYDSLARLYLLESLNLQDDPLIVVNPPKGAMSKVVADSLRLAGFSENDVVEHNGSPKEYESLVILGSLSNHPVVKAPEATRFLESIAEPVPEGSDERIYLSRNAYSRRKLANEDILWPTFASAGFKRVFPEKLTLTEQISLFKGARYVAGNMGAAFSNLAFSPDKVKVLALASGSMAHDFFYDIVCHKDGSYLALQGEAEYPAAGLNSDFSVSQEDFEAIFEKFLT
ncbi:glycosyltransferase 61 family protein [Corynebacterium guangdongense]|nr:glycosyltransferase 61 family protein [Corynebacterium guangdongense]WJZ18446.1 Mycinamicin VI 2''-O-methyltransferase [Corynebacterium guangdongense]